MKNTGAKIIILFVLLTLNVLKANAQNNILPKISTKKIELENQWLHTNNINGYLFNSIIPLGEFELNYNTELGNHKPSQISDKTNNYGFSANKTLQIKNTLFKGKVEYKNKNQKHVGWTARMNPNTNNPYMLADSMSGLYEKNYVNINGGFTHKINSKFASGININYMVANGAKIKDPRPKNKLYELEIMPAFILSIKNIKIGTNIYWKSGRELISYSVVEPMVSYRLFRFLGLGKGRKSINTQFYNRNYYTQDIGVEIQTQYSFDKSNLLFTIAYNNKQEKAEDGTSVPKKTDAGDFTNNNINACIMLSKKENLMHSIKLQFNYNSFFGTEFIQQAYLDNNITKYKTITTLDNYQQQIINPSLHYSLGIGNNDFYYKWILKLKADYMINNTEYIDIAKRDFQNIITDISAERVFKFKQSYIYISATVAYAKNINKQLKQLKTYKAPQEKVAWDNIVKPDFDFITSNVNYYGLNIKFAKNINLKNNKQKIAYVDINTNIAFANTKNKRINNFIKLGITF